MDQLILHMVGDYVTQTHWMAQNKARVTYVAAIHALVYSIPFLLIGSAQAVGVVLLSHFLIDRFSLAKYVVYAKNRITDPALSWKDASGTGYHKDVPAWLSVWLLIAADNTIHLACNFMALRYM